MKRSTGFVLLLLAAGAGGVGYYYWQNGKLPFNLALPSEPAAPQRGGRRGGFGPGDPPPAVLVASPRVADVPVFIDAVGTVAALKTVTVRPQVDGRLVEVTFREGQNVKAGDVLGRIDPITYQAQLDQAIAKKAQDEALLANARLDLARYVRLATDNAGSRQQADTQRALVAQYEAQVRLDQAAIDNARAILSYTTIVSPIDGRAGIRLIDEGNLVQSSSTTGLVVVAQVNPIAVTFSVPQQQLRAVVAALDRGKPRTDIVSPETGQVEATGTLEVVDNQIDQTTGTVKLKSVFQNDQARLWPGQYVSVRLEVDVLKGVTTVPAEAIQRGPRGPFVYALREDSSVAARPVTIAREADGIAVLTDGVTTADRLVTTGFARLADGTRVRVSDPAAAPADGAEPQALRTGAPGAPGEEPRRRGRGRGGNGQPEGGAARGP